MSCAHETNFAAGVANAPSKFNAGIAFRSSTAPVQLTYSPEQRLVITWPQGSKEALSRNKTLIPLFYLLVSIVIVRDFSSHDLLEDTPEGERSPWKHSRGSGY